MHDLGVGDAGQPGRQDGGVAVRTAGDGREPFRAVIDGVHPGDDRQQDLRCADVARRLLAANVLLARLQSKPVRRVAVDVLGHPDQPAGHIALQAVAHRHVAGVRTAEAERHPEPLGRADDDVGAHLPWRREQRQREQVRGDRDDRATLVRRLDQPATSRGLTGRSGVLHQHAEDVAVGQAVCVHVGDHHPDAERLGPGLHDRHGLRKAARVDDEHRAGRGLAAASRQGHRLGGCRRLVEQRGAGHRESGEVAHDRLEVEERLEPALGDLRLVGRVSGVPGRVLEHVAQNDRRRHGAVVAEADHRGQHLVAPGELAQLIEHLVLGTARSSRSGSPPRIEAGTAASTSSSRERMAEQRQHLLLVLDGGPDVAARERDGGVELATRSSAVWAATSRGASRRCLPCGAAHAVRVSPSVTRAPESPRPHGPGA